MKRLKLLIVLSLIGMTLGALLTQHFYEIREATGGFKSYCNLSSHVNCDVVAASTYAELAFGLPVSSFVVGWFLALFGVLWMARDRFWYRESLRAAFLLTGVGSVLSIIYFGIMVAVLHTYCLLCIGVDLISLISFGIIISLKPEPLSKAKLDRAKWKSFAILTALGVAASVFGLKVFETSKVSNSDIEEMVSSVFISAPISISSGPEFPSLGSPQAPITIVEFSDFQCPYCRASALMLNTLLNRFPGKIRVVFRNFPLDQACNRMMQNPGHTYSCEAARVALCAHQQGKFQPAYEAIFEKQSALAPGKAAEFAIAAGVDATTLQSCVSTPEVQDKVTKDIEEGIKLQVKGTPAFYINGYRSEALPLKAWVKVIEQVLRFTDASK
ncbi:MAG: thioredoxin domain-containing protein [Bdellovibrionota bacterium]